MLSLHLLQEGKIKNTERFRFKSVEMRHHDGYIRITDVMEEHPTSNSVAIYLPINTEQSTSKSVAIYLPANTEHSTSKSVAIYQSTQSTLHLCHQVLDRRHSRHTTSFLCVSSYLNDDTQYSTSRSIPVYHSTKKQSTYKSEAIY
jgi:hypothetical protein